MSVLARRRFRALIACALLGLLLLSGVASSAESVPPGKPLPKPHGLIAAPAQFVLDGAESVQRVVVTGVTASDEELTIDYSRAARYESSNPQVATVSSDGLVSPRGDGVAEIRATFDGQTAIARATVQGFATDRPVSFQNQVVPLFSKYGCNSGGCHGKATGQNGFRLSLLGFDPEFDYAAIVLQGRGRRVFPAAAERSLLLLKAVGAVLHGGGSRIKPGSSEYGLIRRWIEQGTPHGSSADPILVRIDVYPKSNILGRVSAQQMIVTATYSDEHTRDVTHEAQFKSNETHVAHVDDEGLVTTDEGTGDTAVMARYLGHVDVYRITVPLADSVSKWPPLPAGNYIDKQDRWY